MSAPVEIVVEWSASAGYVLRRCPRCGALGHQFRGMTDIRRDDVFKIECGLFVQVTKVVTQP